MNSICDGCTVFNLKIMHISPIRWVPSLYFAMGKFWVVATQLACGVLFGLAALALHLPAFFAVVIALFAAVAFCGATHDIVADGVYMDALSAQEQARFIGVQGAFYNLAKLVATGGLVWCAGWLFSRFSAAGSDAPAASRAAWAIILCILALIMAGAGLWHVRALPAGRVSPMCDFSGSVLRSLREVVVSFFSKKHIWCYIALSSSTVWARVSL